MFTINGQQCQHYKSGKVSQPKKKVHITLHLTKQSDLNDKNPRTPSRLLKNQPRYSKKANNDISEVFNQRSKTIVLLSKNLTRTPSPLRSPNLKYYYLNHEFDPPLLPKTHYSQNSEELKELSKSTFVQKPKKQNSVISTRIMKQSPEKLAKITMKDLNLNLPAIIKGKILKKKRNYPSMYDSYNKKKYSLNT